MDRYFKELIKKFPNEKWLGDHLDGLERGGIYNLDYKGILYHIDYIDEYIGLWYEDDEGVMREDPVLFETWKDLFENFKVDDKPFWQIFIFDYDKPSCYKE